MKAEFFKFPSTPHLATLAGVTVRNDKVLSEAERGEFLHHTLVIEEKVDGANLGISFDADGTLLLQNRGSYLQLPGAGQWKKLEQWLNPKIDALFEVLTDRYILFGEWCYAQHSVFYNSLPDWFLGFDVYDTHEGIFLSTELRNNVASQSGVAIVPFLGTGRFSFSDLPQLLSYSKLSDQPAEGLYLRIDQENHVQQRAKLVQPAFIQATEEHWTRRAIKLNQLSPNIRRKSTD